MKIANVNLGFNLGTVVMGAAAVFLAPMVLTVAGSLLRSAAKTGVKGGVMLYDKGKEFATETTESAKAITQEAKAEMAKESKKS